MKESNQISNLREDVEISSADLLKAPKGEITESGLITNVSIGVQYIEAWLGGKESVPLYNMMEDAATAEICRAQIWQWVHHGASLSDERRITLHQVRHMIKGELDRIKRIFSPDLYSAGQFVLAAKLLDLLISSQEFKDFLTIPAYAQLLSLEKTGRS